MDAAADGKARAARGRKQRILWDSDNVTPDGKTSIGVLLEWLTAPGNYERWRDGKVQFGETREKLCSEINAMMRKHGITHRENANIRTQISELERAYDAAVAWLVQNGYEDGQLPAIPPTNEDSDSPSGSHPAHQAEVHVLRLCRYFHVLSAIMRQPIHQPRVRRPYNRSNSTSSTSARGQRYGELLGGDEDSAVDTTSENGMDGPVTGQNKRKAPNGVTSSPSPPQASAPAATSTPSVSNPAVMMPSSSNFANFENTQRMILEAAREDRERKRFQLDEERNKLECEKLRLEVESKKIELAVQRVLARKQLLQAGISAQDVEDMLAS